MGIFRRKKRDKEHRPEPGFEAEVEERERFSHSSGAGALEQVVDQQMPDYDRENPPPAPRGRSSRLHPPGDERGRQR